MEGNISLIALVATFLVSLLIGRCLRLLYPNMTAVVLGLLVVFGGIGLLIICLPSSTFIWNFVLGMLLGMLVRRISMRSTRITPTDRQ
jgi:hypothetical protein